jgi:hypothetical protein
MSRRPDNGGPLPEEMLRTWLREASFVFSGRVREVGASNLDGVEPDDSMATVEVDAVALAPNDVGDLRGQTITVVAQKEGLEPNQQLTFFARSWHYGQTIGVVEVGRTTVPVTEIRAALIDERLRQFEAEVAERVRRAEVIVSGRVLATYRAEETEGLPGVIDGVEWWNAELWIASVEKGAPPEDQRIWFPEGGEPEWSIVPKAYPGQTGVWLLRQLMPATHVPAPGVPSPDAPSPDPSLPRGRTPAQTQTEGADALALLPRRLAALDPLDYHADSDLPRIRTLLWLASGG